MEAHDAPPQHAQANGIQQQPNPHTTAPPTDPAQYYLANYRVGKTLGIGSFGKVLWVISRSVYNGVGHLALRYTQVKVAEHIVTNHKVAIKILNKRKIKQLDMEEKVRREIKILRLFYHPHIIRLYEVIETPQDIYVIMEYVKSGELFDHIVEKGRLQEDEARLFFQQIMSGVEYCHRNMVVHRDLKPENLLLDSKLRIKIADFGLSNVMRDGHFLKTSCGSPNYAAPEVISGKLYAGPEVDVWSCGVILYALLCGSLPFDDENIPNLFKKIKGGIYTLPNHLSAGARDLIPRMLLVDPLKRITIPEIRQHGWFTMKLPRYLAVQADSMANAVHVDEEIVREVCKLGFSRQQLVQSLRRREQNKATVTYYLLMDNRRQLPGAYFREEMPEYAEAHMQHPTGIMSTSFTTRGMSLHADAPTGRVVVERQWRLGLPSRGHPSAIMQELFVLFKNHQVFWKKTTPYNLKCRCVVEVDVEHCDEDTPMEAASPSCTSAMADAPFFAHHGLLTALHGHGQHHGQYHGQYHGQHHDEVLGSTQRLVKFEVQLYKVRDGEYVVDFQRLHGELFVFLDLCGRLVSALKV